MKALELAKELESINISTHRDRYVIECESAAELRRLAKVNAELLEVLEEAAAFLHHKGYGRTFVHSKAEKTIAKAKEQQ